MLNLKEIKGFRAFQNKNISLKSYAIRRYIHKYHKAKNSLVPTYLF
jgi:hypothetical protein